SSSFVKFLVSVEASRAAGYILSRGRMLMARNSVPRFLGFLWLGIAVGGNDESELLTTVQEDPAGGTTGAGASGSLHRRRGGSRVPFSAGGAEGSCRNDAECATESPWCNAGQCVPCHADLPSSCPPTWTLETFSRHGCFTRVCAPPSECRSSDDCPPGEACYP